jgi:hypothetical protein
MILFYLFILQRSLSSKLHYKRYLRCASLSHSQNHITSDTFGALRYRTPKITLQAIPSVRFAIALPKIAQTLIYQIPHLIQADLKYKTYA